MIARPEWEGVNAEAAHIRGEKAGSARYDSEMTDDERRAFENLILICPSCHARIDRLEPAEFPAERLIVIKQEHEDRSVSPSSWATEEELDQVSELLFFQESQSALESSADQTAQDVRVRRLQDLHDVVVEMRAMFNEQHRTHSQDLEVWAPGYGSPETQARLALQNKLRGRTVLFEHEPNALPRTQSLLDTFNWSNGQLEDALDEIRTLIRGEASTGAT